MNGLSLKRFVALVIADIFLFAACTQPSMGAPRILVSPYSQATNVYHTFLQGPEGMEFGPDGNLYVADWRGRQIVRITPSGEMNTVIQHNLGGGSSDVAFAKDGTLYFNDHRSVYALMVGRAELKGQSKDIINRIAFGPDGHLYFTDRGGNIRRLSSDGTVQVVGTDLGKPDDLAFNAAGELLVAESGNQRIVKVNVNTGEVTEFASARFGPGDPIQLAVESDGDVWAHSNGTLYQFDSMGAMVPYTLNGWEPTFALGQPHANPGGIAFDRQGNLWIGDSPNAKITRIEPVVPGGPITDRATITLAIRGFNPTGIAVGLNGDFFAAHSADPPLGPGQILRITPTGERSVFATLSGALTGITANSEGNIFVSEHISNVANRIVKVTPHGVAYDYVTSISGPSNLATGSDGFLYALLPREGKILQITAAETYSVFFEHTGPLSGSNSIAAAPDGGLYMTNGLTGEVWYVTQAGSSYSVVASIPTLKGNPSVIAVMPSGDIFVQTHNNYHLWRIRKGETPEDYAADVYGDPYGLAPSPDGRSIYVSRGGRIDRIPIID